MHVGARHRVSVTSGEGILACGAVMYCYVLYGVGCSAMGHSRLECEVTRSQRSVQCGVIRAKGVQMLSCRRRECWRHLVVGVVGNGCG
jgi:hypothetical protein